MTEAAPAYDELRKPVDFPRAQYIASKTKCECYTQQGSLLIDYPESIAVLMSLTAILMPLNQDKVLITNKEKIIYNNSACLLDVVIFNLIL